MACDCGCGCEPIIDTVGQYRKFIDATAVCTIASEISGTAGKVISGVMEFPCSFAEGGCTAELEEVTITEFVPSSLVKPNLKLLLFSKGDVSVGSVGSTLSVSVGDEPKLVRIVTVKNDEYYGISSVRSRSQTLVNRPVKADAGSKKLYGVLVCDGTHTLAADTTYRVQLRLKLD